MGLRDILDEYKLGTAETSERIDLLLNALRRKPGYSDALKTYGKQPGDLGNVDVSELAVFAPIRRDQPDTAAKREK